MAMGDGAGQSQLHGAAIDGDGVDGHGAAIDGDREVSGAGGVGGIQGLAIGEDDLGAVAAGVCGLKHRGAGVARIGDIVGHGRLAQ